MWESLEQMVRGKAQDFIQQILEEEVQRKGLDRTIWTVLY